MWQGNPWPQEVWTSGPRSSVLKCFASYALVMLFRDHDPTLFLAPYFLHWNVLTDTRNGSSHLSNTSVPNAVLSPEGDSTAQSLQSPYGQGLIVIPILRESKVSFNSLLFPEVTQQVSGELELTPDFPEMLPSQQRKSKNLKTTQLNPALPQKD